MDLFELLCSYVESEGKVLEGMCVENRVIGFDGWGKFMFFADENTFVHQVNKIVEWMDTCSPTDNNNIPHIFFM